MVPSNTEAALISPVLLSSNFSSCRICLLCHDRVTGTQSMWSCGICYFVLHLKCIQSWVRRSCSSSQLGSRWNCPQCKGVYTDLPTVYTCFCGRLINPPSNSWLLPHCCGDNCNRIQDCGHFCIAICHEGPCPPCAKTVNQNCYCGQDFQIRRCGKEQWSCGKQCLSLKTCGQHSCFDICHPGSCPPCSMVQAPLKCLCGKNKKILECGKYTWKCDLLCGLILSCVNHRCEQYCHRVNECPPCPRTFSRSCPCGGTKHILPCLEDSPRCENICNLTLGCNAHKCTKLCHFGPCPPCMLVIEKFCTCGKFSKSALCEEEISCDLKCDKILNCSRHSCKIKCCNGECLPCKEMCNQKLSCLIHYCELPCHSGPCYPCFEVNSLLCACGNTQEFHRCGIKHSQDRPKCPFMCKMLSDCHHPTIQPHNCHFNICPPCTLVCNKPLENCDHFCSATCHSKPVLISEVNYIYDGPWKREHISQSCVSQPCPPCSRIVSNLCQGGHIVKKQKCSDFVPFHCDNKCSRILMCGRHKCDRSCHKVDSTMSITPDSECGQCSIQCDQVRPSGCIHKCKLLCHSYPCPPCNAILRFVCHCGSLELSYVCNNYTSLSIEMQNFGRNCGAKCVKKMSCGHSCGKVCHYGDCNSHLYCKTKVHLRCSCGNIRVSVICKNSTTIRCDNGCFNAPADGVTLTSLVETHFPAKRKTQKINAFYFPNTSVTKRIVLKQSLSQAIMNTLHPFCRVKILATIFFLFFLSHVFLNY